MAPRGVFQSRANADHFSIRDVMRTEVVVPVVVYDPAATVVVDTRTKNSGTSSIANYLVRGNEPLDRGEKFVYAGLANRLQVQLHIDLREYQLINIALLDNVSGSGI